MFCGECGAQVPTGAKFCEKCGCMVDRELKAEVPFDGKAMLIRFRDFSIALVIATLLALVVFMPFSLRVVMSEGSLNPFGSHSLWEIARLFLVGFDAFHPTMVTTAVALLALLLMGAAVFYWLACGIYILIGRADNRMRILSTVFSFLGLASIVSLIFTFDVVCPQFTALIAHLDGVHVQRVLAIDAPFLIILTTVTLVVVITLLVLRRKKEGTK